MPRDARAYLSDILESCDAIAIALAGMDVDGYLSNRLVRSSVERELNHRGRGDRRASSTTTTSTRVLDRHSHGVPSPIDGL